MSELPDRQEILERKADVVRERLLRAVDALEERRHRTTRVLRTIAIAGAIGAAGAATGAIAYVATRPKRRPLIEIHPKPPSLAAQTAERFLLGFVAVLASEGGRWLVRRLLPPARDRQ